MKKGVRVLKEIALDRICKNASHSAGEPCDGFNNSHLVLFDDQGVFDLHREEVRIDLLARRKDRKLRTLFATVAEEGFTVLKRLLSTVRPKNCPVGIGNPRSHEQGRSGSLRS